MGTAEGTLAYMSPEQTGRMNRAIDYRTDYYAMGATLYELATGSPPFGVQDAVEMVHAHVARPVVPPRDLKHALPPALSAIIVKLLAKDADQRYQTTRGLRADLEQCLAQVRAGNQQADFPAGASDIADRFRLPQRIYGRDEEVAVLISALERTCAQGATLVAVKGPAGIGKSRLINELHRPLTGRQGYFLAGKSEALGLNAPYLAIREALADFVEQILGESGDRIAEWRTRILSGGSNLQLLIRACPSLELILGPQPALGEVAPEEARTRLHRAFHDFFAAITAGGRPVCLFFDDLQWAGSDALELIGEIHRSAASQPLLLVCAYRDGDEAEVRALELQLELDKLAAGGGRVERLALGPLTPQALVEFVAACAPLPPEQAVALAQVLLSRTGGNPFFMRAFLESLQADGLLASLSAGIDLPAITRRAATENVVDLLLGRVAALPQPTQELLLVAACLGTRFDLQTLKRVAPYASGRALWPAIDAGLVYALDRLHGPSELDLEAPLRFAFAHDRVRQAVSETADDKRRAALHLDVGRRLRDQVDTGDRARALFDIVGQLNQAHDLITDPEERTSLARLNLEASRAALAAAAGSRALELARAGRELLGPRAWQSAYELALELAITAAGACFVAGELEVLKGLAQEIVEHARTALDAVRVRAIQGQVHYAQQHPGEAIDTYCAALKELGNEIPREIGPEEVERELRETSDALGARTVADLAQLPVCQDPQAAMAMELLSKLVFATLIVNSQLQSIVVCRLVRLSLAHGNVAESANGYIFYGLLLSLRHELHRAVDFGRLALTLAEKFGDARVLAQTYLYANYQLLHWSTPIAELVPALLTAHRYGVEAGNPFMAACGATTFCIGRLLSGDSLNLLAPDMEHFRTYVRRSQEALVLNWHEIYQQTVENLRNPHGDPTWFHGPIYDENVRLPIHVAHKDLSAQFNYHFGKMQLCFLFGEPERALQSADATRALSFFASAFWAIPLTFFDSLCRLAAVEVLPDRRAALLAEVADNQKKLLGWLPHNPRSLEHKVALIEAELARLEGEGARAEQGYLRAVDLAHANGYLHEEAIACERAARFFLGSGEVARARPYLRRAQRTFGRWGADAKVKRLEREFPHLLPRAITGSVTVANLARGEEREFDVVDFVNVLNGSRAISSEVRSERLLQKLLQVLIECGGAQAGYVLMLKDEHWVVEAGRRIDSGRTTMLEAMPLEELARRGHRGLPASIINYAARTRECVLLDDAVSSMRFGHDRYICDNKVGSVLCLPLLRQGDVLGLVYLENASVRGAFSSNNVIVLEVLAAQAVISLENARLYDRLEQQVQARTEELSQRNRELAASLARQAEMQKQLVTQEKLAALGALTAGIAHEIKNPLNFVTNFGEVSLRLSEEVGGHLKSRYTRGLDVDHKYLLNLLGDLEESVGKVVQHGRRASDIVGAMGRHGGPRTGQLEAIDLNGLVADSVKLTAVQSQDGLKIDIRTQYDPQVGYVDGVAHDLNRVLVNLINNARHALLRKRTEVGDGFAPEMRVHTRAVGEDVEVAVRDNGVGIKQDLRDRIFMPFFTTKPAGEGTGLGLSISHDIITRIHRGALRVDSVAGEFAEFVMTIPRHRRDAAHK